MKEDIVNKILLVLGIALAASFIARSPITSSQAKKSSLDGTWELVPGQQLPRGARDIKIFSGGHSIFVAYDTETGKPLYTGGGTYIRNGNSYSEHIDLRPIESLPAWSASSRHLL